MTLPRHTWYSHMYVFDTPIINRTSSEIPGERSTGVPRHSLGYFAKNFKWLIVVCCWPTLEFQDRDSSLSFVVEAKVACRLLSKPTFEMACRLLLKPTLGLQKVRDRDSAVLTLLLYI